MTETELDLWNYYQSINLGHYTTSVIQERPEPVGLEPEETNEQCSDEALVS